VATDPAALFAQYGAIGTIAALALLAVKVMFNRETKAHDDQRARADRLEAELGKLNALVREQYIQTIAAASQAINDANRAVADALAAIRR
jgi:predicted NAD/FAD-binding protein